MVWVTPVTWVAGETVTDTRMNQHVRDNLNALRNAQFSNAANVGNVGSGEDDLHSYSVPAGTLSSDGQSLRWETLFTLAANGNTKTIKVHFGSSSDTIYSAAGSGLKIAVIVWVTRTNATNQKLWYMSMAATTGG